MIRTSLIVGLPGEGEEEFRALCEFLEEVQLERAGAFVCSPEEGTPAYSMEHCDQEVAQRRQEIVEQIQSRVMDRYNASLVGKTLEVLVDGYDEELEQFFGRTQGDSPDIDGRVYIACQDALREGQFVNVRIEGSVDGDLTGCLVEEEER